jgi:23S rRNA pseudouridine1911/1915/1917 synthase
MKSNPRRRGHYSGNQVRRQERLARKLEIVYEDNALVAVNKPAGLAAVPVKGSDAPSAFSLLRAELKAKRQQAWVVHRIDRFTSGILLFAKTEADWEALVQQFLRHTPVREYLAVVRGQVAPEQDTLVHYLRREGMFQRLTRKGAKDSTQAELRYSVERQLRGAALLRVTLVTGLQNQIRVQFSAIGHPVVGDRKYHPDEAAERRIARVALHAAHLQFVHPRTRASVALECEPPQDFQALVRALAPPTGRRP